MDLNPARKELARARRCIDRMKSAQSYDEYDEAWSDFLSRIENVYTKIKITAEHHQKYPSFSSKTNHLRGTDSLLIYLKQARNSAHHGISETSKFVAGGFSFNPVMPGGQVHIQSITFDKFGNATIIPASPVKFNILPSTVEAVPCYNRGQTWAPPESHLGKDIDSKNPLTLAEHGFTFYQNYLFEAEKFLTKK